VCFLAVVSIRAEQLPIRLYTASDGLPSNGVSCAVRDSHGFLWFCTDEGISRFDGYSFTNYTTEQGLPDHAVAGFLETRDGEYWVATTSALTRFNPQPYAKRDAHTGGAAFQFDVYRPGTGGDPGPIIQIAEALDGRIWCLTLHQLFRFDRARKRFDLIDLGPRLGQFKLWDALFPDRDGSLWLGGDGVLARRWPSGKTEQYGKAEGLPPNGSRVSTIYRDRKQRLWVATWAGLCLMVPHPQPGRRAVGRVYTGRDGLPGGLILALFESADGELWLGTDDGLAEYVAEVGGKPDWFRAWTARHGLELRGVDRLAVGALAADEAGSLWLAGAGVIRLARGSFTTYTTQDGLQSNSVGSVFEDRGGRLIAITGDPRFRYIHVFDGERFSPVIPRVPRDITHFTWGIGQIHFQDHTGVWWVATDQGLCRYPLVRDLKELARTLPERIFTERDGMAGKMIYGMFEDSRGDVWISTIGPDDVERWSRATGGIRRFKYDAGGKPLGTPAVYAEDRGGDIWMGLYWRDLARYRNGRFQVFNGPGGLRGHVTDLLVDHAGRLWVASSSGLARVDRPDVERPEFKVYTVHTGLSSDNVHCVTEDLAGRIYVCTGRGIDQLDPDSGRVRYYTEADGLPFPGTARVAFRDRQGTLWFGGNGLTRFVPRPEAATVRPPAIRITRLSVRGRELPVSELGEERIAGLRLRPAEDQLQIDFASLNFGIGENIRYQYKLEGSERDWGPLANSRSVTYAGLRPGSYRFFVRAVNATGAASQAPASIAFAIMPPLWQRWWFLTLACAGGALALWSAYRYRLARLLELERVRTRIATDLHDDIGSSLTQIAVLSEVARTSAGADGPTADARLTRIADLSRELVDSMSDIVWAINPERDNLGDLAYRMRRFASDLLDSRAIEIEFSAPEDAGGTALRAEVRRQTFLIFKEGVHNIVRHAQCRRVEVDLRVDQHRLVLRVSDDGKGLGVDTNGRGHGLANMRRRARALGGELRMSSESGGGTVVILHVPLDPKTEVSRKDHLNR
jgi:signal transduction histidine kinase/ligand-binding sensor domain-containing protein